MLPSQPLPQNRSLLPFLKPKKIYFYSKMCQEKSAETDTWLLKFFAIGWSSST